MITLVTSPRGPLGGSLGAHLPWILLVGGCRLAAGAAAGAATMSALYATSAGSTASSAPSPRPLQHALLPRSNPAIPGSRSPSRYVAGAEGVEVGGDWYSLVRDRRRSRLRLRRRRRLRPRRRRGRDHGPAAVHPPRVPDRGPPAGRRRCTMCAPQMDIEVDGHFATVLVGVGDLASCSCRLANAGHPDPLLVLADGGAPTSGRRRAAARGGARPYPSTTVDPAARRTLLAFTDGLVERRDEDIDTGWPASPRGGPARRLTRGRLTPDLLGTMTRDGDDDMAMLAFPVAPAELSRHSGDGCGVRVRSRSWPRPPAPQPLPSSFVYGATGDLAKRMVLPAFSPLADRGPAAGKTGYWWATAAATSPTRTSAQARPPGADRVRGRTRVTRPWGLLAATALRRRRLQHRRPGLAARRHRRGPATHLGSTAAADPLLRRAAGRLPRTHQGTRHARSSRRSSNGCVVLLCASWT